MLPWNLVISWSWYRPSSSSAGDYWTRRSASSSKESPRAKSPRTLYTGFVCPHFHHLKIFIIKFNFQFWKTSKKLVSVLKKFLNWEFPDPNSSMSKLDRLCVFSKRENNNLRGRSTNRNGCRNWRTIPICRRSRWQQPGTKRMKIKHQLLTMNLAR